MFKRLGTPLVAIATVPSIAPIVMAESDTEKPVENKFTSRMLRPSELPIYEEPEEVFNFEYHGKEQGTLEEGIGLIRQELEGVCKSTKAARDQATHIYHTGVAHTTGTIDYIQDEENILPRVGVITLGGLAGLLLGARRKGGIFKKILYTSVGITGSASLCYPRQSYQITQDVINNAEVYGPIAYNFVAGVKPQLKTTNEEMEKTPETVSAEPEKQPEITEETIKSPPVESSPAPAEDDASATTADNPPSEAKVDGDIGQSNPEDADMYTTRG